MDRPASLPKHFRSTRTLNAVDTPLSLRVIRNKTTILTISVPIPSMGLIGPYSPPNNTKTYMFGRFGGRFGDTCGRLCVWNMPGRFLWHAWRLFVRLQGGFTERRNLVKAHIDKIKPIDNYQTSEIRCCSLVISRHHEIVLTRY